MASSGLQDVRVTNEEKDLTRKIKARAFQIWVEEGQPSGRDREHWEQAKAEVIASQPK
jgi:hypothetical protein